MNREVRLVDKFCHASRHLVFTMFVLSAAWLSASAAGQAQAPAAEPAAPAPAAAARDCPPVPQAPTPQQIQDGLRQAQDRGALWQLTKDGRTSYLFGTLHVGQLAWAFPGPKLTQALRATEVVALEVDVSDPAQMAALTAPTAAAAPTFELSERDRERLQRQADAACIPREALQRLHPVMQAITYVILSARRAGLDPAYGQEQSLIGFARASQRPVISLESLQSQLAMLVPSTPAEAREALDKTLDDLESGRSARQVQRMADAWVRGDLASLGRLEWMCDCTPSDADRQAMRRLNDSRNPGLADRIAEEHAKGRPLLAAVGLLHMVGPEALTRLLQERGFAVERVAY